MTATRLPPILLGFAGVLAVAATPASAAATIGEDLFNSTCARCHSRGPQSLRTPANSIGDLLRSGSVRAHRFSLTEQELADLETYLIGQGDQESNP